MLSDYEIKPFYPNHHQVKFFSEKPNGCTHIGGRRGGKTTSIAWIIKNIANEMPKSTWAIVGSTYKDMMRNTLPTVIEALATLGIYKGRDYFFGRKAHESWKWPEPYRPLLESDEAFWFRSGTVFPLVSLDRESSNRGPCYNGRICDEGLNLIRDRFERETTVANSGDVRRWKHIPYHHATFIFSSMPWLTGQFLLEHSKYYDQDDEIFNQLWKEIHKLEIEMLDNDDIKFRQHAWKKRKELRTQIKYYKNKKNGFLYMESNVFDNIKNVGFPKIVELRKTMGDLNFRIEIINEKLALNTDSFYPMLNDDKHLYSAYNYNRFITKLGDNYNFDSVKEENCLDDIDVELNYDPHKPLHIGWDVGGKINFLVIAQDFNTEIRIIHSMYVKSPEILDHLFKRFTDYYEPHHDKTVYFYYDPATGNSDKDNSIYTSSESASQILSSKGWNVVRMSVYGTNIFHMEKFQMINKLFLGDDERFPKIKINSSKNSDLLISIKNTGIKQNYNGFKKDKGSETKHSINREHATDGSDAFDILIVGMIKPLWESIGSISPITI